MSLLAAVLHVGLLASAMAGPASARVSVVVDAAVVDREALAARLVVGTEPLARLLPNGPSPSASIVITGELLDFQVYVALPTTEGTSASSRCPCTHAELVAHVQHRLAQALHARADCPAPRKPIVEPSSSPPPPPPRAQPRVEVRGEGLRRPGRLGVALVGLGGLGLGLGTGALAALQITHDDKYQPHTNLRPAAVTAVATGGAALMSGAVLLLLDRRLRRPPSRSRPRSRSRPSSRANP